ncbi:MAG: hypothetical protein ACP5IX_01030 [Patescibacteria group bacterium]
MRDKIKVPIKKSEQHRFIVSDLTSKFQELARNWLGQEVKLEEIKI